MEKESNHDKELELKIKVEEEEAVKIKEEEEVIKKEEEELKKKEEEKLKKKEEEELKKKEEELKKYFIHKRFNKQSLIENPQLEEEKQNFQNILNKITANYLPIEYHPSEAFLKKKNFILSEQAKKRLSLLNHYISKGINVILEGPTGTSKNTFSRYNM